MIAETVVRTFCVVSCLISGIYASIIFYYFRNAKRMIWFAALCFALCANINMSVAFYPHMLFDTDYIAGIMDNIYFASHALVTLCLSVYSSFSNPKKTPKLFTAYNYICFLVAGLSMVVPDSHVVPVYVFLCILSILTCIYSLILALLKVKEGETNYWFPAAGYLLFFFVNIYDLVITFIPETLYSPRMIAAPIILVLHGIMMTLQYTKSLKKTRRLSASLSETIEKITHSHNALMCTQMKSDFLYKSLDLISQKCDEDPFTAEDLTVSLSKYLRHTLNFLQLQGIVPLNNEIELTKSYISIERERNPKLTFEYKFPDPIPDFHVPPLSIQPLVENAIEHAFDDTIENPKITITIIPYRDYFHIDVSDNGVGMDEDMVSSLTESLHDSARIGVYNINTRLISLFGKGLVIQSAKGVGTSISFVVPPDAIAYLKEKEKEALG